MRHPSLTLVLLGSIAAGACQGREGSVAPRDKPKATEAPVQLPALVDVNGGLDEEDGGGGVEPHEAGGNANEP